MLLRVVQQLAKQQLCDGQAHLSPDTDDTV